MSKYGPRLDVPLADGDLSRVRVVVVGYTDIDRYMEEFEFLNVARFAEEELSKSGLSLFGHGTSTYVLPPQKQWGKDTWLRLQVEMTRYCSLTLLGSMEMVMRHLRNSGHPEFQIQENNFTRLRRQQMSMGAEEERTESASVGFGDESVRGTLGRGATRNVTVVKKPPRDFRPVAIGAAVGLGVVLAARLARFAVGIGVGCLGIAAGAAVGLVLTSLKGKGTER